MPYVDKDKARESARKNARKWRLAHPEESKAACRRYYASHKDQYRAYQIQHGQKHRLQRRYGISVEEYEAIFNRQGGVCAICLEPPKRERLAVDHDHKTGKVRGLLHKQCNRAIGLLKDDQFRVRRAANYLYSEGE